MKEVRLICPTTPKLSHETERCLKTKLRIFTSPRNVTYILLAAVACPTEPSGHQSCIFLFVHSCCLSGSGEERFLNQFEVISSPRSDDILLSPISFVCIRPTPNFVREPFPPGRPLLLTFEFMQCGD